MNSSRAILWLGLTCWLMAGCDGKELGSGLPPDTSTECNQCHGSDDNAAPPKVTAKGEQVDHELMAGAHQAHLAGATLGLAITCDQCHKVPESVDDAGHANGVIELLFGALASAAGAAPAWDKVSGTCNSTYCHGSTLSGGVLTAPAWIGEQDATNCGSCHGFPPPEPHTQVQNCFTCHRDTIGEDDKLLVDGKHLNGEVDASGPHPDGYAAPDKHGNAFNDFGLATCNECHGADLKGGTSGVSCDKCHAEVFTSCTFCHGGVDNDTGAPPADLAGYSDTILDSIGAHTSHLEMGTDWHGPVVCSDCHKVPSSILDDGHADGGHGDLTFGALATTGELEPDFEGGYCSSVYCHGATLAGGQAVDPLWSQVDGSLKTCTSCHGMPPPLPHPQSDKCDACHAEVINADGTFTAPEKHIDGEISAVEGHPQGYLAPDKHGADFLSDGPGECTNCHGDDLEGGTSGLSCNKCHDGWKTSCTFCHGGIDNDTGAPPEDVAGNTDTTFKSVGAHSAHLATGSDWHNDIGCNQCHSVPTDVFSAEHLNGVAKLTWGSIAAEESEPQFNGTTCSSLYCHGADLGGGDNVTPDWTKVDQNQVYCGSCHSLPPTSGHPNISDCSSCHTSVVNPDNVTFKNPSLHLNGEKDF